MVFRGHWRIFREPVCGHDPPPEAEGERAYEFLCVRGKLLDRGISCVISHHDPRKSQEAA